MDLQIFRILAAAQESSELTKGLHAKLGGLLQKAEEPGNKKTSGGEFPAYR